MTRNPAAKPSSLVGIGQLVRLEGERRDGSPYVGTPERGERRWLAWRGNPDTGDMIIVRPDGRARPGSATTRQHYRTFHDADPVDWSSVVWHPPRHAVEHIGFARSVTYRIPDGVPSNKEDSDWVHYFGDFGGGVDLRDDKRYWPGLAVGPDGSVYLLRRKGNKYALKDWLEG